jgi:hypothetical protein
MPTTPFSSGFVSNPLSMTQHDWGPFQLALGVSGAGIPPAALTPVTWVVWNPLRQSHWGFSDVRPAVAGEAEVDRHRKRFRATRNVDRTAVDGKSKTRPWTVECGGENHAVCHLRRTKPTTLQHNDVSVQSVFRVGLTPENSTKLATHLSRGQRAVSRWTASLPSSEASFELRNCAMPCMHSLSMIASAHCNIATCMQ